ncbi:DUF2968 domain-containing protein [Paraburkholderia jirisanensis]
MKSPLTMQRAVLLTAACALLQHGGIALAGADAQPSFAESADVAPASGTGREQSAGTAAVQGMQGDVAELTRLIQRGALNELRTTYNGGYGASLFFYPQELTYYVALFQDKQFWRVIKSQDDVRAEQIYANFAQQTAQLAEAEISRTKLQAQTAFLQRVIDLSQDRAKRLQADLDVAQGQQAKAAEYQRQVRGETALLHDEEQKAQAELRNVQQQVQQLQRQTEAGLPAARK